MGWAPSIRRGGAEDPAQFVWDVMSSCEAQFRNHCTACNSPASLRQRSSVESGVGLHRVEYRAFGASSLLRRCHTTAWLRRAKRNNGTDKGPRLKKCVWNISNIQDIQDIQNVNYGNLIYNKISIWLIFSIFRKFMIGGSFEIYFGVFGVFCIRNCYC